MLDFARKWFAHEPERIGIDFGTNILRIAQVHPNRNDFQLRAAASAAVPANLGNDIAARMQFYTSTVRDLIAQSPFRGKSAVVGLPAAWTRIFRLKVIRQNDSELAAVLPRQISNAINAKDYLFRHTVVGASIEDGIEKLDVIVTVALKSNVDALLAATEASGLNVAGIILESSAIVDCFGHVYRRKADANATTCFVDIGGTGSRVTIARGNQILYLHNISIGGDDFNAAVAEEFNVDLADARLLRQKVTHSKTRRAEAELSLVLTSAEDEQLMATPDEIDVRKEGALERPISHLIHELRQARAEYDSGFPGSPVERLVICGGEARSRFICQRIARSLELPSQIGDPMVRLSRTMDNCVIGGIDRRQPQPDWAVALGLAMGPPKSVVEVPGVPTTTGRSMWKRARQNPIGQREAA